jgi:fructokinase
MPDILTIGEVLMCLISTEQGIGFEEASTFEKMAGGAAANVAVGLAHLGISTGTIGRVGDEPMGRFVAQALAAEGVDVRELGFEQRSRTGLAFISLTAEGEPDYVLFRHPGADTRLSPGHIEQAYVKQSRAIVYDSNGLVAEPVRSGIFKALAIARRYRGWCVFNVRLRPFLWGSQGEARYGLNLGLDRAEIVKLSLSELEFLSGTRDPAQGTQALWSDGMRLLTVTQGEQGCAYRTANHFGYISGYQVHAIDRLGCGDAFLAGLLSEIMKSDFSFEQENIERALRFANAAAALTTTRRGTLLAFPTREQVETLLTPSPPLS